MKDFLNTFFYADDEVSNGDDSAQTKKDDPDNADDGSNENGEGAKTPEQLAAEQAAQKAAEEKAEKERQHNAEQARLRRERERQEELSKVRKESYLNAVKDATGGINTFTDKPIETYDDAEQYNIMKSIEKNGGDPIKDYPEEVKKRNRERYEREEAARKNEERTNKEITEFRQAHPDVKLEEIVSDKQFQRYSDGKLGGDRTLLQVYDEYQEFMQPYRQSEADKKKQQEEAERKAREEANRQANPGSLSKPAGEDGLYTADQLDRMTAKEILDLDYELVQKSYDKIKKRKN